MKDTSNRIFRKNNITDKEYLLFMKIAKSNGKDLKEASLEVDCINDMLVYIKSKSLLENNKRTKTGKLRKDRQLYSILDSRIQLLCTELKELNDS